MNELEAVEFFHLALLQAMPASLAPRRWIVKGGVNLRLFFASHRLSEDIDLDVLGGEMWRVEEGVERALASSVLTRTLGVRGVTLVDVSHPKATDVTQRWKLGLARRGVDRIGRTRIEFSAREGPWEPEMMPVPEAVGGRYGMGPIIVQHYGVAAATEQKILALARRSETRARDVFDLDLLLRSQGSVPGFVTLAEDDLNSALSRARDLTYLDFSEQVVPFVDAAFTHLYQDRGSWSSIQGKVVGALTGLITAAIDPPRTDRGLSI